MPHNTVGMLRSLVPGGVLSGEDDGGSMTEHVFSYPVEVINRPARFLYPSLIQEVLKSDKHLVWCDFYSDLIASVADFFRFLEARGGRLLFQTLSDSLMVDSALYVWPDNSYITLKEGLGPYYIECVSLEDTLADVVREIQSKWIKAVETSSSRIYSIALDPKGSIVLQNLGFSAVPLVEENYLPEVVTDVKYAVSSFNKATPNGRICILHGDPGTGKTYLIRSISGSVDAVFIIVPPNMIDSLDKPGFLTLLIDSAKTHKKPIILVIEDGDVCLASRGRDNISTLASLLNMSDGILGNLLDIRMVISTNTSVGEIDRAIMRPGRLCRNIHVGLLPYTQANVIYQRLKVSTEVNLPPQKFYSLAEVYEYANVGEQTTFCVNGGAASRPIGFIQPTREAKDLTVNLK